MRSLKGISAPTFVGHMIYNQKKFHACNTIFVGLHTFLEKESKSKTHA
jgi:hypothetical protein